MCVCECVCVCLISKFNPQCLTLFTCSSYYLLFNTCRNAVEPGYVYRMTAVTVVYYSCLVFGCCRHDNPATPALISGTVRLPAIKRIDSNIFNIALCCAHTPVILNPSHSKPATCLIPNPLVCTQKNHSFASVYNVIYKHV